MKRLIPTILVLLLMPGSVYADDYQDEIDAIEREDYKTGFEKFKLLAEQGFAGAQADLSSIYSTGSAGPRPRGSREGTKVGSEARRARG